MDLEDPRQRLGWTEWPDQAPDLGWDYGVSLAYLRELADYWRTRYDWRRHKARRRL
jgi:hypothetical protein